MPRPEPRWSASEDLDSAHAREVGEIVPCGSRPRLVEGHRQVLALGHPLIREVRGEGLLRAIGLTQPVAPEAMTRLRERGFIVNAVAPDALRLAPPLVIEAPELDTFVAALPDDRRGAPCPDGARTVTNTSPKHERAPGLSEAPSS